MGCIFKIGDIVHAKSYNDFAITDRGKPCEVVSIAGSRIELKCLWDGCTFWESSVAFEKMYPSVILNSGDTVEFVKGFYLEYTEIPKGTKVEFLGYYSYGAKVFYKDEIIRVPMPCIKKYYSGMRI